MKEFIHNHFWIIPVVLAFASVGLGILIGWCITRGDNSTFVSTYSDYSPSDEAIKWTNNPANPANPASPLNPMNPANPIWNNLNNP